MFFFYQINRDVSLQSFLAKNKVFSEVVQYEFESCRHDKVSFSLVSISLLIILVSVTLFLGYGLY